MSGLGEQLLPTTQPVLARAIEPLERGSQGHACPHPVLGDSSSEAPVCPPPLWAGCAYRPPPSGLLAALHLTWVTSTPFPREPLVSPERITRPHPLHPSGCWWGGTSGSHQELRELRPVTPASPFPSVKWALGLPSLPAPWAATEGSRQLIPKKCLLLFFLRL